MIYRIKKDGLENLPPGGALLICNHVSYVDAAVLSLACPRRIRFIAHGHLRRHLLLRLAFRMFGVIPIEADKPAEAVRRAVKCMQDGEYVCVFPEGQISRTGLLIEIKRGFEVMAKKAGVPVVPAFLDSLWGSIFSYEGGRVFWKLPRRLPYPVRVCFGEPIPPEKADAITARQALLDLGEAAFRKRSELRGHLADRCVRSILKRRGKVIFVDHTAERKEVKGATLLAAAKALAEHMRRSVAGKRVGIVLPPGAGSIIANLAALIAGKIPANLNFTAGRSAIQASLRLGEIDTIYSAEAMKQRLGDFPWPEKTFDLKVELAAAKKRIIRNLITVWLTPGPLLVRFWRLPRVGDEAEAGLLFTSGSSGDPKGVVLTHRNILANTAQISATGILTEREVLLACLPVFHSFGFTVTLWYPLLNPVRVATVPSPLDAKKIAEVMQEESVTVFVGAPTFIRPLLKKAQPQQLRSVRFIVSGAEKMPVELYEGFMERFEVPLMQGYGLTETSPVVSVNLPDPPRVLPGDPPQPGNRVGSVGRLLPGITARIVHAETGDPLALTEAGILLLRGANIFPGYLKDAARTSEALHEGWFVTGDIARFDEDGFLFIEGRLSRFSKIAGEMVPHGTVEQKIAEAFGWEDREAPALAVVGVPDEHKGEALVLLTTEEATSHDLHEKLAGSGLPNLWIPKKIHRVRQIPLLGSGKLDLKRCKDLAMAAR